MSASVTTRGAYLALFATTSAAIEFENTCLSSARDHLPAEAIAVLDGGDFTPAYWAWLADQLLRSEGA